MSKKMPRTPFSTPLSGSARETELRLKNIFSGPKKRPPALFLALVFAACIFCGNLVSCQVAEADSPNSRQGDASLDLTEHVPADVSYEAAPLGKEEQALVDALFRAAERQNGWQFQSPAVKLMSRTQKDGWVLGALLVEDHLENTLILGIMDEATGEVPHAAFQRSIKNGFLNAVPFRNHDGEDCLLYVFNGQENGQYTGEAGLVRFDGESMTWEWPVEGDVRCPQAGVQAVAGAQEPYQAYWDSHLALLAPGGVDVYTVNPDFQWGQEEPASLWQLDHGETFWSDSSSAEELPMPVYFQSLQWLNEYTGDPGGWMITSLTLDEEKSENQVDCYTLWAHTPDYQNGLTADLFFPYESEPTRPRIYGNLYFEGYHTSPGERDG